MIKNQNSLISKGSFILSKLLMVFLLVAHLHGFGQGRQITGTVYDETGETLPGVNVVVKGTTNGTITSFDGTYSLVVSDENAALLFSFVGYLEQTIPVGNKTQINVTLLEDVQEMDEVVVVGYGTQKKSDLTGSIASIGAESLEKQPSTRVDEAIQGKAAGVMVLQNSGQPGASPVIRVRGLATVNGGTPLVVIDGISGGSIGDVNPSDIESIEILKDAASQGIYGSAGGNGVILITTKKGNAGKLQTKLDVYAGLQMPWKTDMGMANSQQFAAIYNQYQASLEKDAYFPQNDAGVYLNPLSNEELIDTKWTEEIFRMALVQNYNLSLSGGKGNSRFFFGANYNAEDGTVHKTSSDRFIVRLNAETKLFDRLTIGEHFNISQNITTSQGERNEYGSPLSTSIQMLPFVPVYATDGSGNYAYREAGLSSNIKNPLAQIEYNNNLGKYMSINGNAFARVDIIKGMTFETRFGMNYAPGEYKSFTPAHNIGNEDNISPSQSVTINQYNLNVNSNYSWQWQNFLTYNFTLMEKNNFSLIVGTESGYNMYKFDNRSANGVDLETEKWLEYSDTSGLRVLNEKEIESSGYAYFGRLNYDYNGIVLFQANFRRDYSSKFGPNNRAGNFPSASLGLKFSEFDFIKDLNFIDFGKIRVGYGATGNSDIQPFLYLNSMGPVAMTGYPFGGVTNEGAALLTAANPDLKWETVITQNIGADFRFLNNRLGFSVDFFSRRNQDMLLRKSVPLTVGYIITDAFNELGDAALDTRPLVNYGTLNNRGYEFTLSYKDKVGKLQYNLSANLTHAVTTIDDIGDPLYAGTGRGLSNVTQTRNGEPVSAFYGYKTDGVYQENDFVWYKVASGRWARIAPNENGGIVIEGTNLSGNPVSYTTLSKEAVPGRFRYVDTNGDKEITTQDMVNIGDPNPDFVYGFSAFLEYENFDLNMFFQGSYGNDIFNMMKVNSYNANNGGLNWHSETINSYVPAVVNTRDRNIEPVVVQEAKNINTGIPAMNSDFASSDFYVEDGSYLRLKNIQLGYTLPASLTQKMKIQRMRVYVGAKNLLTFTKYTGFDPEVGETTILERGFDRGTYPQSKMFTLGLNLIF